MKGMMNVRFFAAFMLPLAAGLIAIFNACTPIQVGGEIVLKADGSGSRKFEIYIYNEEIAGDNGGNAYDYLRVHGEALKAAVEQKLKWNLKDSSWLTVTVGQGYGAMYNAEIVTLSFDFKNFNDYINKMKTLAKFGGLSLPDDSEFKTPKLKKAPNDQLRFTETGNTALWAVRPLFLAVFDDPNLFDITCNGKNTYFSSDQLRNTLITEAVEFKATLGANAPKLFLSGADIDELFPAGE